MNVRYGLKIMLAGLSLLWGSPVWAQQGFPSFADLAERLTPSVVNISTLHQPEENADGSENIFSSPNPTIDRFFNQKGNHQTALGSGFIISDDGYIITNNHVIDKAEEITVTLSDNSTEEAKLVGVDPKTDLALIKINTEKKLQPVVLGDSDKIRVGDWVLAIGNPFGLGGSVTAGIVSAKSRDIEAGPYDNFIQTDASINQGSSGGPMFDMNGQVIGINSAIFSTTGGSMGIGFAIPVNLAKWVVEQLKSKGEVKRGWIGVKIQPNSEEIAASVGLNAQEGVLVAGLNEGASAGAAGITAGDIILSFDGHAIDNTKNLSRMVAETEIGRKVKVELWRDKRRFPVTVDILEMPEETEPAVGQSQAPKSQAVSETEDDGMVEELDIRFSEITPELMDKYSLSAEAKGVVITEIRPGSDAEEKGLRPGDVVAKIDKKDVFTLANVREFVNEAKMENNRPVLLLVQDKGIVHFAALKLKEKK